ncbi:hypothetical protein K488DRAFT_83054 [Vararia minispora EC-137]|uniref:Uncharacterized protein n=1 Tax=Vararia minispora EC-137 TaxID=1314806 RepID=A0ACB8QUY2_9AGAM|nr:hypothetical protein K488DRAFT_83054 [Vararia minispora EC-137]
MPGCHLIIREVPFARIWRTSTLGLAYETTVLRLRLVALAMGTIHSTPLQPQAISTAPNSRPLWQRRSDTLVLLTATDLVTTARSLIWARHILLARNLVLIGGAGVLLARALALLSEAHTGTRNTTVPSVALTPAPARDPLVLGSAVAALRP